MPLADLQQRYAQKLPPQAGEAEALWDNWTQGNGDALPALRQLLHRLIGTAGSYEFEEVAAAATALKQQLGPTPPPKRPSQLDTLLCALRSPRAARPL